MNLQLLKTLSTDHEATITGTPMVPIHRESLAKIAKVIEWADAMRAHPSDAWTLASYDAVRAELDKQ